jgi:hypothetical protein
MSADNWRVCPKCEGNAKLARAKREQTVKDAYGKVPIEEYEKMMADLKKEKSYLDETLREDYEILITKEGKFYVDYGASCTTCNFSFNFKHEEQV